MLAQVQGLGFRLQGSRLISAVWKCPYILNTPSPNPTCKRLVGVHIMRTIAFWGRMSEGPKQLVVIAGSAPRSGNHLRRRGSLHNCFRHSRPSA